MVSGYLSQSDLLSHLYVGCILNAVVGAVHSSSFAVMREQLAKFVPEVSLVRRLNTDDGFSNTVTYPEGSRRSQDLLKMA